MSNSRAIIEAWGRRYEYRDLTLDREGNRGIVRYRSILHRIEKPYVCTAVIYRDFFNPGVWRVVGWHTSISVNESINCLRQSIPPPIQKKSDSRFLNDDGGSITEKESKTSRQKDRKPAVLARALEYIKQLEAYTKSLCNEVATLDTWLRAFEVLAMNGSMYRGKYQGAAVVCLCWD